MTASVFCAADSAAGLTVSFRSRMASLAASLLRICSFDNGAGVGEPVMTGACAVGREHPASRHKQATSRVRAIFFIMAKQQEAWGMRALEGEHFLRGRRIGAGKTCFAGGDWRA